MTLQTIATEENKSQELLQKGICPECHEDRWYVYNSEEMECKGCGLTATTPTGYSPEKNI